MEIENIKKVDDNTVSYDKVETKSLTFDITSLLLIKKQRLAEKQEAIDKFDAEIAELDLLISSADKAGVIVPDINSI